MASPKLRALTRTQLQSLAKREAVRAVGKTEEIIRRLVRKHPKGVPVSEGTDNPSASSAPLKQTASKTFRNRTPSPSPLLKTCQDSVDHKGKGKQTAEAASPSPSSSDALEQLLYLEDEPVAGPSNSHRKNDPIPQPEATESHTGLHPAPAEPVTFSGELSSPPSSHATHELSGTSPTPPVAPTSPNEQEAEEPEHDGFDYPHGAPTHFMLLDALRQSTHLVNTIPTLETHIAESLCLLRRAKAALDKATPDARELAVTREYLETFLLGKLKTKRELWDGTARMDKAARKLRMAWLRAEREAESVKRWEEANAFNQQHGLDPEPLSAFRSESDDEVIESLQTTPGSSRSGSCKRSREGSDDTGSEGEDTDDGSQRKRART